MYYLENRKPLNIYDTIQRIFIKFLPNYDRNVADHLILVTSDLENVGQSQNLQTKAVFWHANISKKKRTTLADSIDSKNYLRVSE